MKICFSGHANKVNAALPSKGRRFLSRRLDLGRDQAAPLNKAAGRYTMCANMWHEGASVQIRLMS